MVMDQEHCQLRVGIVGASCVGKTCIVKRFLENSFHGSLYNPTPGVDFGSRRITLSKPTPTSVTLIILDIGGTAINSKMLNIYLDSGIDIFMLVYDMTNMSSLTELRKWIEIIQNSKLTKPDPSLVLIGTKGDLEHLRTVRLDSHTKFTHEFGISMSFIVSAKSGESVSTCFLNCAAFHLTPDSKNRLREHTLVHGQLPKKLSAAMTPNNPHAIISGTSATAAGPSSSPSGIVSGGTVINSAAAANNNQQQRKASAITSAAQLLKQKSNTSSVSAEANSNNDLHSTVCSLQ